MHGVVTMVLALAGAPLSLLGQLRDGDALAPVVANLPLSTRVVIVSSTPSAVLAQMKTPWRRM
ncbi:MAG TPA: hypothetical protein VFF65_09895, partial [Phycisphaerales bacterium]|nr:hypothetical protein [Phycisphaerales bacterium]